SRARTAPREVARGGGCRGNCLTRWARDHFARGISLARVVAAPDVCADEAQQGHDWMKARTVTGLPERSTAAPTQAARSSAGAPAPRPRRPFGPLHRTPPGVLHCRGAITAFGTASR